MESVSRGTVGVASPMEAQSGPGGYPTASIFVAPLEVGPSSIQGLGLFTRAPVRAGEVVIRWGGTVFTGADIRAGRVRPESLATIGDRLYIGTPLGGTPNPDEHLNHSCEPGLWMADEVTLIARRDIAAGEEVTIDYALWEADTDWRMPCRCGAALCRGTIDGEGWRDPVLQRRYAGHFSPYLNARIARIRAGSAS